MSTNQLNKVESFPAWLLDMFSCIDKKDFAGARKYIADNVVIEFAHYNFTGVDQVIKSIGGFDVQFKQYHHGIEQVWQGDGVENNMDAIAAGVSKHTAAEIEQDFEKLGLCVAPMHTYAEWLEHPQGKAVAANYPQTNLHRCRAAAQAGRAARSFHDQIEA
jgi:hypothetical protein